MFSFIKDLLKFAFEKKRGDRLTKRQEVSIVKFFASGSTKLLKGNYITDSDFDRIVNNALKLKF